MKYSHKNDFNNDHSRFYSNDSLDDFDKPNTLNNSSIDDSHSDNPYTDWPETDYSTVVSHSAQSDVLRAFNISSETHRNNNYSRTIDYTGCKTVLITMNRGSIMSDSMTNYRFQELHKINPATCEVISLSDKPLHKTPIYMNKNGKD